MNTTDQIRSTVFLIDPATSADTRAVNGASGDAVGVGAAWAFASCGEVDERTMEQGCGCYLFNLEAGAAAAAMRASQSVMRCSLLVLVWLCDHGRPTLRSVPVSPRQPHRRV
jgi:hypothetical protein